jgi:H+/Cl- antiporter ClcA
MHQAGKFLIVAGIILIIAGLIVYFAGNKLSWLGHLPGDIRIEKENVRFYFPITTMIILSIVLSVIVYLIRKFF